MEEIRRIERLLTTFSDDSQTNQVNGKSGIEPVYVELEEFDLIQCSLKISALTQGAFDITYGSIDTCFWNFDTKMVSLTHVEDAKNAVRLTNYKNVCLDSKSGTVFLKEKEMRIGFGGICKGCAVRAKHVLQKKGVENGVVNSLDDLITWGVSSNGKPWTAGIADPDNKMVFFFFKYQRSGDCCIWKL